MDKIDLNTSPFSEEVSEELKKQHQQLVEEIQNVMEKHGIDVYLVTVKTEPPTDPSNRAKCLYSSFIRPPEEIEVMGLYMNAISTMKQFFRTIQPTAPGGVA